MNFLKNKNREIKMSCNHAIRKNPGYIEYEFKVAHPDLTWKIRRIIPCGNCRNIICNVCFVNLFKIGNGCFNCPYCLKNYDFRSKYISVDERLAGFLNLGYSNN
jgi:hypothetical protein